MLTAVKYENAILRFISLVCPMQQWLPSVTKPVGLVTILGSLVFGSASASEPVFIGFDGAYAQKTNTAAAAIELGTQLAISQINGAGGVLDGRPLVLVTKDNHGIAARAEDNFIEFSKRSDLVAVYGGKFSQATIKTMSLSNGLPLLSISVWGSADPITRNPETYPFVYRLSLRDKWAIPAMMQHAKRRYKADRLCAVMPQTAWGRSGKTALKENLGQFEQTLSNTSWYNGGQTGFARVIANCAKSGGQAVIFIANEQEGAKWIQAMAELPDSQQLPTVSHWGVTGGALHEMVGPQISRIDFDIIQTFGFINNKRPEALALAREVLADLRFSTVESITSPVGIAQAFDMTHLLAMAINQAGSTDRKAIQQAMQGIGSYEGVIRTYTNPFSAINHDALTASEVLFVRLQADGAFYPIQAP